MRKLTFIFATVFALLAFTGITSANQNNWENDTRMVFATLERPQISAASAIVMDARTGKVLFSHNADEVRAIASLTKVMTTLLTLEAGITDESLDVPFRVDNNAVHVEGTTMGLRENDIVTRRALCYGMMLPSGNDASNVAAVSVGGGIAEFVTLMNTRAKEIGMSGATHFANPHGLDQAGHQSTARDMAILTAYAMERSEGAELFREICASKSVRLEFGNPPYGRWLRNNNRLLTMYSGCIGVKTGFTDAARRCLISAAQRDAGDTATLIAVTLNAPDDWNDHSRMLDYAFAKLELLYDNWA
ncbi:MAG: D-alanyl-D-alanine carboxypeptidase [Oscillospiraceae bacterium]|nr:D-alanyl-D-alanine carboxypeptidase [Oscillospiraceae bacterium]